MANKNEVKLIVTADTKGAETGIKSLVDGLKQHWLSLAAVTGSVVGAYHLFIQNTISAVEELRRLHSQTGISTDLLQDFKIVARSAGVELDAVSMATFIFSQKLADANNGIGDSRTIFKALGVDLHDNQGKIKDTGSLFIETAKKFANMAEGFEKTDLEEKMFGRGGRAISPMFDELSEKIDKLKSKSPIFSEENIQAAKEYNQNIIAIKENISILTSKIGNYLIPKLNEAFDFFRAGGAQGMKKQMLSGIQEQLHQTNPGGATNVRDLPFLFEGKTFQSKIGKSLFITMGGLAAFL